MRKIIVLALAAFLILGVTGTTLAQQNRKSAQELFQQAASHLMTWLNLNTPITQLDYSWQWQEQIYADAGFGCGEPGVSYPDEPRRAVDITIRLRGEAYDYRVSWDGSILVLCGDDGLPLYRSDSGSTGSGNNAQNGQQGQTATGNVPPGADFYAWVYMQQQRRLYLLNETGPVASVTRPQVTGENPNGRLQMAFSRDGRYLLQVSELNNGNEALTLYDMATGSQTVLPGGQGERISLGLGDDPATNIEGETGIFSPDFSRAAVTFTREDDPSTNSWRVVIIDLATGTTVAQLNNNQVPSLMANVPGDVVEASTGPTAYRARPMYYDAQGGVHLQLIRLFTEGADRYPAIVWSPDTSNVESSPYIGSAMDIRLSDGIAVFPVHDPNLAFSQEPARRPPNNAITRGDYSGGSSQEEYILGGSTSPLFDPNWADGGNAIVYASGYSENRSYIMRDLQSGSQFVLPGAGVGVPGGALTVVDGQSSPQIAYYEDATTSGIVWDAPPMNGQPAIVWTQPAGVSIGFQTTFDGQNVNQPINTGTNTSAPGSSTSSPGVTPLPTNNPNPTNPQVGTGQCGTFQSIVKVGIRARSTIIDGSPLNVRTEPNTTTSEVARIIPEDTRFDVIGGPTCADGYTWWRVRLDDGVTGWVAEAGQDHYFIEPAPGSR